MTIAAAVIGALLVVSASASESLGNRAAYPASKDSDNYIVGGTEARRNEFSWQISLQVYENNTRSIRGSWEHTCGGSIISDNWVLTAAHCVVPPGVDTFRVVVGAHSIAQKPTADQIFPVKTIVVHPKYNDHSLQNDIALVKIRGRFNFNNRFVGPIRLATAQDGTFEGERCIASGWGRFSPSDDLSNILLKTSLSVMSTEECARRLRDVNGARLISSLICALHSKLASGICNGDSGGPLACVDEKGVYKLAGITSFYVRCGSKLYPSAFTRVSSYRTWIDQVISRH